MQNLEVVQNGPAKFGLVCENALILTVLWQRKVMKICFKKLGLPKHFCDHGFLGNKIFTLFFQLFFSHLFKVPLGAF